MTEDWPDAESLPVRDSTDDRSGALLDELDTLIAELDAALAEQNTARLVVADAEMEMSLREASATLTIDGRNEAERKARLTLALRSDPAYQQLAQTARHARAGLLDAERRLTVIRQRIALVRAALTLLAPNQDDPDGNAIDRA